MSTPLRAALAALAPALLAGALGAQIRQPGVPPSTWAELPADVPTTVLARPDVAELLREDEERGHHPLRYGAVLETTLDAAVDGRWDVVPDDGALVWRARIASPGALSLGVTFSRFDVPAEGRLFLYGEDGEVHGAYGEWNEASSGVLAIEPVAGDLLTVEYVQPGWVQERPAVRVGSVVHDYRGIHRLLETSGGGAEGACTIDVNCPEGDPYQDIKQSVVRTLSGGSLCSGAILNTTAQDQTPYLLTAEHCGGMTSGVFLFGYEKSGCGSGAAPGNKTMSGAALLAANATYDSQLYRLNNSIPASYQPFYAGWDRSTSSGNPAVHIGHGGGAPKQIAIDSNGASLESSFWRVTWSAGTLEGGSSGGPLFNGQKRVIGPACCVSAFVCSGQTAWFGRFDRFYTVNGLATWLDPTGSGATNVDGFDPDGPSGPGLTVTSISPAVVEALEVGSDQIVTITGTGFDPATTKVEYDGVELGGIPSPYTVVSSTQITFDPPQIGHTGLVLVTVKDGADSAAAFLTVAANDPPALQANSGDEPVNVFSFAGVDLKMASGIGDLFFLAGSLDHVPTVVPGIVSLDIGNAGLSLVMLGSYSVPAKGWTELHLPLAGLPPVTTVWLQGAALDPSFTLPVPESNTQEVLVLF